MTTLIDDASNFSFNEVAKISSPENILIKPIFGCVLIFFKLY
jgi:hypothetical protein